MEKHLCEEIAKCSLFNKELVKIILKVICVVTLCFFGYLIGEIEYKNGLTKIEWLIKLIEENGVLLIYLLLLLSPSIIQLMYEEGVKKLDLVDPRRMTTIERVKIAVKNEIERIGRDCFLCNNNNSGRRISLFFVNDSTYGCMARYSYNSIHNVKPKNKIYPLEKGAQYKAYVNGEYYDPGTTFPKGGASTHEGRSSCPVYKNWMNSRYGFEEKDIQLMSMRSICFAASRVSIPDNNKHRFIGIILLESIKKNSFDKKQRESLKQLSDRLSLLFDTFDLKVSEVLENLESVAKKQDEEH